MAWVAVGLGVATIGTSLGMSLSGAGQPTEPNLASSSRALSDANAAILPIQRGLQAAQQSGEAYTFHLPNGVKADSMGISTTGAGWYDTTGKLVSTDPNYGQSKPDLLQQLFSGAGQSQGQRTTGKGGWAQYGHLGAGPAADANGAGGQASGQNANPTAGLTWRAGTATMNGVPVTQNSDGSYTINFKGTGQADVQTAIANQQAKDQLALAQQYDPQFISQALAQERQADPESFAARAEESKLIQDQVNRPLNDPVSELLNSQVQEALSAASNNRLTDLDTQRLNAAAAQALAARGGAGGPADFAQPLTSGFAGEQRQAQAAQAAMGFLASGSSPEDIAYRREQQNLGNLSAEVNGKTPQSQFGSLSGAQAGPTAMVASSPLPVLPADQSQAANQVAIQNAQTTNRFNANQVNPWMQGLSSLVDAGSIAGGLGWKPFTSNS